jgi:hypothetical protein
LAAAGLSRQAEAPQQETMPKREQYANDEDWLNARDEFRDRQRDAKVAQERGRESAAKQAQRVSTLLSEAEKLDGFDRDTFDSLPVSQAMADAILDSDIGSKLIAHLTLNEGEAERISKLSPARQAAEIGKLEAKLSTVKASNTPPPIKPIGSAGSSSKPVEQMSQSEYEAMRAKQGARWAR